MKTLNLVLLLLTLSCNEPQIKLGECLQKPDEAFVWKVIKVEEGDISLERTDNNELKIIKIDGPHTYSQVDCP